MKEYEVKLTGRELAEIVRALGVASALEGDNYKEGPENLYRVSRASSALAWAWASAVSREGGAFERAYRAIQKIEAVGDKRGRRALNASTTREKLRMLKEAALFGGVEVKEW